MTRVKGIQDSCVIVQHTINQIYPKNWGYYKRLTPVIIHPLYEMRDELNRIHYFHEQKKKTRDET
jgi:hypothetical protein